MYREPSHLLSRVGGTSGRSPSIVAPYDQKTSPSPEAFVLGAHTISRLATSEGEEPSLAPVKSSDHSLNRSDYVTEQILDAIQKGGSVQRGDRNWETLVRRAEVVSTAITSSEALTELIADLMLPKGREVGPTIERFALESLRGIIPAETWSSARSRLIEGPDRVLMVEILAGAIADKQEAALYRQICADRYRGRVNRQAPVLSEFRELRDLISILCSQVDSTHIQAVGIPNLERLINIIMVGPGAPSHHTFKVVLEHLAKPNTPKALELVLTRYPQQLMKLARAFERWARKEVPCEIVSFSKFFRVHGDGQPLLDPTRPGTALKMIGLPLPREYRELIGWPSSVPSELRLLDSSGSAYGFRQDTWAKLSVQEAHQRFLRVVPYLKMLSAVSDDPTWIAASGKAFIDRIFWSPDTQRLLVDELKPIAEALATRRWGGWILLAIAAQTIPISAEATLPAIRSGLVDFIQTIHPSLDKQSIDLFAPALTAILESPRPPAVSIPRILRTLDSRADHRSPETHLLIIEFLRFFPEEQLASFMVDDDNLHAHQRQAPILLSKVLKHVEHFRETSKGRVLALAGEFANLRAVVKEARPNSVAREAFRNASGPPVRLSEVDFNGSPIAAQITDQAVGVMRWGFDASFGFSALTMEFRRPAADADSLGFRYGAACGRRVTHLRSGGRNVFPGHGVLIEGIEPERVFATDSRVTTDPFHQYRAVWPWVGRGFQHLRETTFSFQRGMIGVIGPDDNDFVLDGVHRSLVVFNEHFPKDTRFPAFLVDTKWLRSFLRGDEAEILSADLLLERALRGDPVALPVVWSSCLSGLQNVYPPGSSPHFSFEHLYYHDRSRDTAGHLHLSHLIWRNDGSRASGTEKIAELRSVHERVFSVCSAYRTLHLLERIARASFKKGQSAGPESEFVEQDGVNELNIDDPAFLMLRELYRWNRAYLDGTVAAGDCPILRVGTVLQYAKLPDPSPAFDAESLILTTESRGAVQFPIEMGELTEDHLLEWLRAFRPAYLNSDLDMRLYHPRDLV